MYLIWVLSIVVSIAGTASAGSIGFYSANFDPPTEAQVKIVACILGDAAFPEDCRRIGKQVSRLIVWVSADSREETYASARERVLMLKKALSKHGERVEVLAGSGAESQEKIRAIQAETSGRRAIRFISETGYKVSAAAAAGNSN